MGCNQSSSAMDGARKKRRTSGLVLIEPVPVEIVIEEKPTKSSKKSGTPIPVLVIETAGSHLSEDSKLFIKRALLRSGVFADEIDKRNISNADVNGIVQAFVTQSFKDGEFLFHQEDFPCDHLYIVKQGVFRGLDGSHCKAIMRPKDIVGELGFFHQNPRMLSIVAGGTNPSAFALNKRDFKAIVEKGRDLKNVKIMEALSEAQKYLVKDRVTIANYLRGDIILRRGTATPNFYIILSGQVGVTAKSNSIYAGQSAAAATSKKSTASALSKNGIGGREFAFKYPGDYFGEESFVKRIVSSSCTFVAVNEVSLCVVSNELFNDEVIFGPVKAWIIKDMTVRQEEAVVSNMRRQKSFVKFNDHHLQESFKSENSLSQLSVKFLDGPLPPGILVKKSVSTVDTDENENENENNSNASDPPPAEYNETDDMPNVPPPFNINWLLSLNCGLN